VTRVDLPAPATRAEPWRGAALAAALTSRVDGEVLRQWLLRAGRRRGGRHRARPVAARVPLRPAPGTIGVVPGRSRG